MLIEPSNCDHTHEPALFRGVGSSPDWRPIWWSQCRRYQTSGPLWTRPLRNAQNEGSRNRVWHAASLWRFAWLGLGVWELVTVGEIVGGLTMFNSCLKTCPGSGGWSSFLQSAEAIWASELQVNTSLIKRYQKWGHTDRMVIKSSDKSLPYFSTFSLARTKEFEVHLFRVGRTVSFLSHSVHEMVGFTARSCWWTAPLWFEPWIVPLSLWQKKVMVVTRTSMRENHVNGFPSIPVSMALQKLERLPTCATCFSQTTRIIYLNSQNIIFRC